MIPLAQVIKRLWETLSLPFAPASWRLSVASGLQGAGRSPGKAHRRQLSLPAFSPLVNQSVVSDYAGFPIVVIFEDRSSVVVVLEITLNNRRRILIR